jgi:hypothetical protein
MKHIRLALAVAVTGFVFTSKPWLKFLNSLSPETGLLIKNIVVFIVILGLHRIDGFIGTPHRQALGFLLVYTAFTIVFNYQSQWITEAGTENVEHQTPDGALYVRARTMFTPEMSRIVVFVLIPFIFVIFGSTLVTKRVKLD